MQVGVEGKQKSLSLSGAGAEENSGGQTRNSRFEEAKRLATTSFYFGLMGDEIQHYHLTEPQRFEVAKIVVAHHGDGILNDMIHCRLTTFLSKWFQLTADHQAVILKHFFIHFPMAFIRHEGATIQTEDFSIADLKTMLGSYLPEKGFSHLWADILWDRVQKRDVGLQLLRVLYKLNQKNLETGKDFETDSLATLSQRMGLSYKVLNREVASYSPNTLGRLYELGLDIEARLEGGIFEGMAIDETLWKKKQLSKLLDLFEHLRDLLHLRGNNDETWQVLLMELNLKTRGITAQNIDALLSETGASIVSAIRKMFGDSKIQFGFEDLKRLKEKWGDLKPIYTLLARFNGNPHWRQELPMLAKVFKASLDGKFEDYKFEGDPADETDQALAKAQLASLKTSSQITEWRKIRSRVSIFHPAHGTEMGRERLQQQWEIVHGVIQNNLRAHLDLSELSREVSPQLLAKLQLLLPQKPSDILQAMFAESDRETILHAILNRLLEAKTGDLDEIRNWVRFLKRVQTELALSAQAREDIKSILDTLSVPAVPGRPAIIFTTTFTHPKLLLMIGDLVQTSSCQNYRTGNHIEALLGYVVDANTAGLASFAIDEKYFEKMDDYRKIFGAIGQNKKVKAVLDGDKMRVAFEVEGETRLIYTLALSYAHLRHVVKLGEALDEQGPGVAKEPRYAQMHSALPVMRSQAGDIVDEIATAVGGKANVPIRVAKTRNPGGTYSDSAGGIKQEGYVINPKEQ